MITDNYGMKYSIRKLNNLRVITHTHAVSSHSSYGLVDSGSNNGLAGEDILLCETNSNERVDVIGCTDGVDIKNFLVGKFYSVMTADNGEEVIGCSTTT